MTAQQRQAYFASCKSISLDIKTNMMGLTTAAKLAYFISQIDPIRKGYGLPPINTPKDK